MSEAHKPTPLGRLVRQLRAERGMFQTSLSNKAGLSGGFVTKLENGFIRGISRESTTKLAAALEVEEVVLLYPEKHLKKEPDGLIIEETATEKPANELRDADISQEYEKKDGGREPLDDDPSILITIKLSGKRSGRKLLKILLDALEAQE